MCFDDPIYLDRGSFEDLMVDTDQHRICWMYHDILSHPRIAWLFDKYAGKGTPIREAWTTMAWVAAGYQEDSFYLLFKWYEDFYDPPQRSDLYFVEREGPDGEIRVRFLNRDFQNKLERRELAWCESFPVRVSQNASYFFGDSKFDANPVGRILQLLGRNAGRELECFDWYFGRRSDGEKSRLCATIAAYFRSVQAIREILFSLVASDGKTPEGSRHMRADDLLEILKPVSAQIDEERLPALGRLFQDLADGFFDEPSRAPYLSRGAGRALTDRTETGELRWLRLGRQSGRRLLRELYSRCAPRSVWDVFHRWQGEVYYTVLRRPLSQDVPRGVYLLSRFEDQTGLDVTGLFWLENVTVGVAHLCKGEFFEELLDLLLSRPTREAALPAARPREETMVSGYSYLLQEAFEQYGRGMG